MKKQSKPLWEFGGPNQAIWLYVTSGDGFFAPVGSFKPWSSGSGIGAGHPTLKEAIKFCVSWGLRRLTAKIREAERELEKAKAMFVQLRAKS